MPEFGAGWRKKMVHYAKIVLDANSDGEINREDYEIRASRYEQAFKLEGTRAKQARIKFSRVWNEYFGDEAKQGKKITPETFPDLLQKKGMDDIRYTVTVLFSQTFDIIDLNGDGMIQIEEFETFYKTMNLDAKVAAESFKALDTNSDGVLSHDEFVKAAIDFFIQNESTHPSNMLVGPMKD